MLRFLSPISLSLHQVTVGVEARVEFIVEIEPASLEQISIFLHWGKVSSEVIDHKRLVAGNTEENNFWIDDEVSSSEIEFLSENKLRICKKITPETQGTYGVTAFAEWHRDRHQLWLGRARIDDVVFTIEKTANDIANNQVNFQRNGHHSLNVAAIRSMRDLSQFVEAVDGCVRAGKVRGLALELFKHSKRSKRLQKSFNAFHRQLRRELVQVKTEETRAPFRHAFGALETLGLDEVVFVSPEGYHAKGGGLAQVITGLTDALSEVGLPVTVISALYHQGNGSRHLSAAEILRDGLNLSGTKVPLEKVGFVKLRFGPTFRSGTHDLQRNPRIIEATVYKVSDGFRKLFFLYHRRFSDCLYPEVESDEALLRALFLSRGALELINDGSFGINPQIIITNDWLTGLVHPLLAADNKYKSNPILRNSKTLHVVHNCGRAYQGRFYVNQFGEDLWPLVELANDHFFGIADPNDRRFLNLTAAAVRHVRSGILAVSKPYARQLLSQEGGDGLEKLFAQQESKLFGISNGVDLDDLRELYWRYGESARKERGLSPLLHEGFSKKGFLRYLPVYKEAVKFKMQSELGLNVGSNNVLISFIGRITEQKGVELLSNSIENTKVSLLEAILKQYPNVQFLIAGPLSAGDVVCTRLVSLLKNLERNFPGRIKGVFDFLSHPHALHLTEASDLLLMPSRYEPGGISQLEALSAGTLVVARDVGGITATLVNYHSETGEGDSFLFDEYSSAELHQVLSSAILTLGIKRIRYKLMRRALSAANDWSDRVPKYLSLFQHLTGVLRLNEEYPFLQQRCAIVEALRPIR